MTKAPRQPAGHGPHGAGLGRLDVTRGGSRDYTPDQAALVLRVLLGRVGPANAIQVADLARMTGLDGRTVRAIVTDRDGEDYLLGGGDDGLYVCTVAEQGDALTARCEATAATLGRRVLRRRTYAAAFLPRRQPALF